MAKTDNTIVTLLTAWVAMPLPGVWLLNTGFCIFLVVKLPQIFAPGP